MKSRNDTIMISCIDTMMKWFNREIMQQYNDEMIIIKCAMMQCWNKSWNDEMMQWCNHEGMQWCNHIMLQWWKDEMYDEAIIQ